MVAGKKNWKKRLGIVCGTLFILYTVLGFIGLPLLLRYVALRGVNKQLAGVVEIGAIRVNPFSCSLLLSEIQVRTEDGEQVFTAGRFYGNFAFWSLFGKGWRFQEVHLGQPEVTVAVDRQGRLNLLRVLKPAAPDAALDAAPEPTEREPIVIPLIRVDKLWLEQGGFDLSLSLPGGEFVRHGRDINLELTQFSSNPQATNPYGFVAKTAQGESVQVEGNLRLNPLSTRGTVSLADLQLSGLDVFAADAIGVRIDSGSLSLRFDYLFSPVSEPHGLFVQKGQLAVRDVALASADGAETFARLGLFEATGFGVDLLENNVHLDSVRVEGSALRIVRDKDGVLNLIRYLFPEDRQREIAELVQTELVSRQQQLEMIRLGIVSDNQDIGVALTSAWHQVQQLLDLGLRFSVGELAAVGNVLVLRDAFPSVPVDFTLSDIAFKASDVRNYGAEPFPFELSLRTSGQAGDAGGVGGKANLAAKDDVGSKAALAGNGGGSGDNAVAGDAADAKGLASGEGVAAASAHSAKGEQATEGGYGSVSGRGDFTPESDTANFSYNVADFDLATFAPYLKPFTTAQLLSARAFSTGSGSVSFPAQALPQIKFDFEAQLKDLRVHDPADGLSVLAVKSIDLENARVTSDPIAFHADLLHIVSPALRVVRDAGQQINLLALVPLLAEKLSGQGKTTDGTEQAAPEAEAARSGADNAQVTAAATGDKASAGTKAGSTARAEGAAAVANGEDAPLSAAEWQALMVADAAAAVSHSQVAVAVKDVDLGNISLGQLRISDGSVAIEDAAVVPPASFRLSDAELSVQPVVLRPDNVTTFSASGRLADGASGFVGSISGEFLTLDPLKSTSAEVRLKDFLLAPFGGYSEPMVGRALDEGVLTSADFRYTIADSKLKGENRIQMQSVGFAPRRDGSTGPRLPLDLGIAILSDRSGAMRLDLPVSGDLADPSFDLSRVIQYALINVLERLVTAPFAVLGSLLDGGGADGAGPARFVTFAAGSAEFSENQAEGLRLLADVLYERPTLGLQLRPVLTDAADLSVLREHLFEQRVQAYAQQHDLDEARATQRLYDQLLSALPMMPAQARAGIEAMIAQAATRAGAAATTTGAAQQPLALSAPPPMVEGGDAAQQTVLLRSIVRSRKGRGFLVVSETLQVLVPAAGAAGDGATGMGDGIAGTGAGAADAGASAEGVADAVAQSETAAPEPAAEAVAEPSLADKRTILLSQTMVTQAASQALVDARTAAIAQALESAEPHPLAASRIRVGEPWQPQPEVPEQKPIPGVYFELEALKGAAVRGANADPGSAVGAGTGTATAAETATAEDARPDASATAE